MLNGMKYSLLVLCLIPFHAWAEDWICKDASSLRSGNLIQSCGSGQSPDEDEARTQAFQHAKDEFNRLCEMDSSCKNHAVIVNPKRTTCEEKDHAYHCYRMIEFEIESNEAYHLRKKLLKQRKIAHEQRTFKVKIGMSKEELIRFIGIPDRIEEQQKGEFRFFYKTMLCQQSSDYPQCSVTLKNNQVIRYWEISPIYDERL